MAEEFWETYRGFDIWLTSRDCPYRAVDIYEQGSDIDMVMPIHKICTTAYVDKPYYLKLAKEWIDNYLSLSCSFTVT